MKVIKIQISAQEKPSWTIEYEDGKLHDERWVEGYKRFSCWGSKKAAKAWLEKIQNDNKRLS